MVGANVLFPNQNGFYELNFYKFTIFVFADLAWIAELAWIVCWAFDIIKMCQVKIKVILLVYFNYFNLFVATSLDLFNIL